MAVYQKMRQDLPGKTRPDQTANPDLLERWEKEEALQSPKL